MLTIYGVVGSRASRCMWTAEEIGLAYEHKPISTLDGTSRSAEYRAINPSGKIPAMSDGDVVMTESMAINTYIAQNYGLGGIWPAQKSRQAEVLQWTFWSATELEYYIGSLFPQFINKAPADRDHALVDRLVAEMMRKLPELEHALEGKDYILGDFTLADINVSIQTFYIITSFGIDLTSFPNICDWTERCRTRPARLKIDALIAAAKRKPA